MFFLEEAFEKKEGSLQSRPWQRKGRGVDDSYAITVIRSYEKS
jgi:hypothetical protein